MPAFAVHDDCSGGKRNLCEKCSGEYHNNRYATNEEFRKACIASVRRWQKAHPEHTNEIKRAAGRQRLARMSGGKVTVQEIRNMFLEFAGRCAYCCATADTIDHVLALSRGGKHSIDNLVPACSRCNSSKHDKSILEFLIYRMKQRKAA
jgi:5-methylcytosine-specific restriction endonuclease McrA